MDAHDCKDIGKALCERNGTAIAFDARADRDDPSHPDLLGPGDHSLKVRSKVPIVEVGVCLDQFHGLGRVLNLDLKKSGKHAWKGRLIQPHSIP
jgi:hypothetical protein